jgi:hypothetical protein
VTYTIKINEVVEGDVGAERYKGLIMVQCEMNANSDAAAEQVMNDLLISVSKHNNIHTDRLNTNLYKTQWINGI